LLHSLGKCVELLQEQERKSMKAWKKKKEFDRKKNNTAVVEQFSRRFMY